MNQDRARRILFARGDLSYMLRPYQATLRDHMRTTRSSIVVTASHRGSRKTTTGLVFLVEECVRRPGISTKFFSASTKQVRSIVQPIMRLILRYAPDEARPRFDATSQAYFFPNGSVLELFGADTNADSALGTSTHIALLDEAARFTDLPYTVNSLLLPRVILVGGKIILASTPAVTPSHPFTAFMRGADAEGHLFRLTVDENPYLSPETIEAMARSMGGRHTTEFRREALCEVVTESTRAVLPELITRPLGECGGPYGNENWYVAVGPAGAAVGVAARFRSDGGVDIVDERFMVNVTPKILAASLPPAPLTKTMASKTFLTDTLVRENRAIQTQELPGTDLRDWLGASRDMCAEGGLFVSPGCPVTRRHLSDAVWDTTGKKFDSSGDGAFFEAVLAVNSAVRDEFLTRKGKINWGPQATITRDSHGTNLLGTRTKSDSRA